MGMCFPGTGKSGDLPPRKECAVAWHEKVLAQMPNIELIILIGKCARELNRKCKKLQKLFAKIFTFTTSIAKK